MKENYFTQSWNYFLTHSPAVHSTSAQPATQELEYVFPSKPQTYVITPKKEFVIGGNLHEHVHVTKGDAVITAGEVRFENENGSWGITNINNLSNGYHPGSSYKDVKNALRKAKISCPDSFTEVFPKDGYFTEEFLSLQPLADYQD